MGFRTALAALLLSTLWAGVAHAGVGESPDGFVSSEFAKFFNITESERIAQDDGSTVVRFEPGSFQESIDVVLWLDSDGTVFKAALHATREWVGDEKKLNPFAKDLIKSFISQMICPQAREAVGPLVKTLWEAQGSVDRVMTVEGKERLVAPPPEVRARLETLYGQKEEHIEIFDGCQVQMENWTGGDFVWLSTRVTGPEPVLRPPETTVVTPPPIDDGKLFLGAEDLKAHGLTLTQDSPDLKMKVWTRPEPDALVQRVVDIRWIFETPEEAGRYHLEHLKENSEGAPPLKLAKVKPFGTDLKAFLRGADDPMLAKMGLDMNMYCFLFTQGRVLAKVFVAGAGKLTLKTAAALAGVAQKNIEKAQSDDKAATQPEAEPRQSQPKK